MGNCVALLILVLVHKFHLLCSLRLAPPPPSCGWYLALSAALIGVSFGGDAVVVKLGREGKISRG